MADSATKPAETARCWTGAEVWCKHCGGAVKDLDDEYGSLADGGSYERFECIALKAPECKRTIYVQLPD